MNMFFVIGGVIFWGLLALAFGKKVMRRVMRPFHLKDKLYGPSLLPYTSWFRDRYSGFLWAALRKLRLLPKGAVAAEVIDAHRTTSLAKMKALRDVMVEIDH